ncbi:S53 family peptidase [Burkholderia glumae]|uniref:S53 family peptidase n=3 Tax=Burkholderia glumae TaxID=337 RepID=A0AAP9XW82_BURGL|nr:S53 family peptidase [Burkholderia glumae]ACR32307.1 serine protease, subtilase family protein [Burkholderia glumae BGR1]AJY63929.1 pseudomonalisin [Burkholderia glumae LMG 2196 = ATCC 33617]MCM2484501.1 S53 family peptidase [Burkholderia glumae]MCM2510193.1 S53 family peptidase [Burkholderia glumae]MCM2539958.1 S53 family peptidase [Burkholderia glumae]
MQQRPRYDFSCRPDFLACLPLVVAATLYAPLAQAASDWVPTHTAAFLVPTAPAANPASSLLMQSLTASAVSAPAYRMKMNGAPALAGTRIAPLEISQPVRIAVTLKLRNQTQLDQLVSAVSTPGNRDYGRFITRAEFQQRFAPLDTDAAAVASYLRSNGFSDIQVAPGNGIVTAVGNASTVQAAFHARLKRFSYDGRTVYANDTGAFVPAKLGSVVDAIVGLQDVVRPKHLSSRIASDVAAQAADPTSRTETGTPVVHAVTDFAKIYGASHLPPATGTTVGIITWGDVSQTIADLKTFTAQAGLPTVDTLVVPGGEGTLADDGNPAEWNLDSQAIVGTSGGVKKLIFYSAINGDSEDSQLTEGRLVEAMYKAVTDNQAKIINVSLSLDETAENAAGVQAVTDELFKQAAVQGQIFSVASGDGGPYQAAVSPQGKSGAIGTFDGTTVTPTVDLTQYSVAWPANSPYVVAVGGTKLSTIGATHWAGETVWNDGLFYADLDGQGRPADNYVRLLATGSGISKFEDAPAWQTLALGSSFTRRALPDVSFAASRSSGAWIIVNGKAEMHAGTSLASPIFVGGFARVETAHDNAIGLPTPWLYANVLRHHSTFRDVTEGNNGYQGHGYTAKAGWDNATGFGSLDFGKLSKVIEADSAH